MIVHAKPCIVAKVSAIRAVYEPPACSDWKTGDWIRRKARKRNQLQVVLIASVNNTVDTPIPEAVYGVGGDKSG